MRPTGILLALLVSCSSGATGSGAATPPPPRLPGTSITHTRLCECRACMPHSCCEDTGLSVHDDGQELGMSVSTCEPRCGAYAFRVAAAESCEAHRPAACCAR